MQSVNETYAGLLASLNTRADAAADKSDAMGQSDFLEIMLAQMKNQDPLSPLDGADFLGQLAQFGTVDGVQSLERSFADLSRSLQSTQALQASSLVGRTVLVNSQDARFDGSSLQGVVDVPSGVTSVTLTVSDASGRALHSEIIQVEPGTRAAFQWNGSTDNGEAASPGTYRVSVQSQVDGQTVNLTPYVRAGVESVTLAGAGQGAVLNLSGLGAWPLHEVQEVL